MYSTQIVYIAFEVIYAKTDFYDIGRWDLKNDKSSYIQLFIATPSIAFLIMLNIMVKIMIYGSETNLTDLTLINLFRDH